MALIYIISIVTTLGTTVVLCRQGLPRTESRMRRSLETLELTMATQPSVHTFDRMTSGEAYDETQCRDDIRFGDVLAVP